MRKFILCFTLAIAAITATAQSSNDLWKGSLNFDPIVTNFQYSPSFNFQFTGSRQIHDKVTLGIGTGLGYNWNFKGNPKLPLFLNVNINDYAKNESPFLDIRSGYSFDFSNSDFSCFYFNPTLGYRFGKFGIGIGYQGSIAQYEHAKWSSEMNIRLSYYFGYHSTNASRTLTKGDFSVELSAELPIAAKTKSHQINPGLGIRFAYLLPVIENFNAGLMAGISIHEGKMLDNWGDNDWAIKTQNDPLVLAVRGKYRFQQIVIANKIYPWAQLDLGYRLAGGDINNGFYCSPAIGLSHDVREGKSSIDLGLGYSNLSIYDWNYTGNESKNAGIFRISLGYTF